MGLGMAVRAKNLAPTSTKASVRSLARSITGKWRPATIFTFSFPGIVSAPLAPRVPAKKKKHTHTQTSASAPQRLAARGRGGAGERAGARAAGDAHAHGRERAPG